jgi:hypothetical protein
LEASNHIPVRSGGWARMNRALSPSLLALVLTATPQTVYAAVKREVSQVKPTSLEHVCEPGLDGRTRLSLALEAAICQAAQRHGLQPSVLRVFAVIESGGNSHATTGSYHGVYQLSHSVFRQYGGRGSIFDLRENTNVAARKLREEIDTFTQQYGRAPTALDLYLIHQQGVEGAARHMADPDAPAWLNMHRTGKGQKKGPKWARLAIWGNVPTDERPRFPGGVNSITSRQFMDLWGRKIARLGGGEPLLRERITEDASKLAPKGS